MILFLGADDKELLEGLKGFRAVEITARKNYESDIFTFRNFEITNTITKIKVDEDMHIRLLDELIKMLKPAGIISGV